MGFLDLDTWLTNDLQHKLGDALERMERGQDACQPLDAFVARVLHEAGRHHPRLTAEQVHALLYTKQIGLDLGC